MCSNSELDPCGEDLIQLSFHTVKPDGQAQIVPNQSLKASYATGDSCLLIVEGSGGISIMALLRVMAEFALNKKPYGYRILQIIQSKKFCGFHGSISKRETFSVN